MKNTLTIGFLAVILASTAYADETATTSTSTSTSAVSSSVSIDVTKTTSGKYVTKTTISMDTESSNGHVGFDIDIIDGSFSLGDWKVGTAVGSIGVSFGKQGDLFPVPGLESVGGTTLANPTVNESVQVTLGGLSIMAGFDDWTTDISDLDNLQVALKSKLGLISTTLAVDYNTDTKAKSYAAGADLTFIGEIGVSTLVTYDTKLAYEVTANTGRLSVFVNGDTDNTLQHIGAGINLNISGLDVYAEASYDTDAKSLSPAVGLTYKF